MKKFLVLSLFTITFFCFSNVVAQEKESTPYLFDEFEDAYVTYKDGRRFSVKINYDLVTEKFMFIEAPNPAVQEFSEPDMVVLVKVGERVFLPQRDKALEVIQHDPKFHVSYSAKLRKAPKNVAYGGTSETASVDEYSRLSGVGTTSGTHVNNKVVAEIIKTYYVKIKNKNKSFYDKNSFLKQLPKEKRETLSLYIDENNINFSSISQVLELYEFVIKEVNS